MAPNRMKTLYGVGVMGYGKYSSLTHRTAYDAWANMLERCYSPRCLKKHPTYIGCTVADEWHSFQNFVEWFDKNYIQGYHLDKDLTILGNKEYSPSTCVFVPRWLNNILLDSKASRGVYPVGVTYLDGKYRARFSCNGVCSYLGLFGTPELAYMAYCKAKGSYLIATASIKEIPEKIRHNLALLGHQLIGGVPCP